LCFPDVIEVVINGSSENALLSGRDSDTNSVLWQNSNISLWKNLISMCCPFLFPVVTCGRQLKELTFDGTTRTYVPDELVAEGTCGGDQFACLFCGSILVWTSNFSPLSLLMHTPIKLVCLRGEGHI
jgi:hypothetical protein